MKKYCIDLKALEDANYASSPFVLIKIFKKIPAIKRLLRCGKKSISEIEDYLKIKSTTLSDINLACYAYILFKINPQAAERILKPLILNLKFNPVSFFFNITAHIIRFNRKLSIRQKQYAYTEKEIREAFNFFHFEENVVPKFATAAGTPISVGTNDTPDENDPDPRTCDYLHFDFSSEQLGKTGRYNCWGFTFLPRRYWINSDIDADNIIRDNCREVSDGQVRIGDIIRYQDYEFHLPWGGSGRLITTHTGRVWKTDGNGHAIKIRSKWGSRGEYIHSPSNADAISLYGSSIEYFRQRLPLKGISDIWIKDSDADYGEQCTARIESQGIVIVSEYHSPAIFLKKSPQDSTPDYAVQVNSKTQVWALLKNRGDQAIRSVKIRYYAGKYIANAWKLLSNPVGPIDIPANSSLNAPSIDWYPSYDDNFIAVIAYINDDPKDSNNPDPIVYPFDVLWDNNIAIKTVSVEITTSYYVNKNAQSNGDHEVHKSGCSWFPEPENRIYLGDFSNCHSAVREAKKYYPKSNGCYYCSPECHTT